MTAIAHSLTRILNTILIRRPMEHVFDYVTAPKSWPVWHPVTLAVHGATDHSLEIGEQVVEDFHSAGQRGSMTWTVRERQPPIRWVIEGTSDIGINATITYRLEQKPGGTLFARELCYWKPGVWFQLLDRLFQRRQVLAESAEALRRIKQQLETEHPHQSISDQHRQTSSLQRYLGEQPRTNYQELA
jgi:hypothetical protein